MLTKRVETVILTSDKINFKSKPITRDKKIHCIMTKGSNYQVDIKQILTN